MIRLVKIVALFSMLGFFVASQTFGYFSAQATSPNNSITAGTLYLGKDERNRGILEGSLKLEKMIPGGTPKEFSFPVKNIGNLKAHLNALSVSVKDCDSKYLANAIRVNCYGPRGEKLYSGSLLSLDGNAVPAEGEIVLEPGETKTLAFTFQLDHRAGNWYKGKGIEISVIVHAGQNSGQKLDTDVVVAGKDLQEAINQARPRSVVLVPSGQYGKLHINRSDIAIKAKDVVFDTVLSGFALTGQCHNIMLQGLTVDGKDNNYNPIAIPDSSSNIIITDNIFLNDKRDCQSVPKFIIAGKTTGNFIQRNDFSSMVDGKIKPMIIFTDKNSEIRYNLGIDLDPSVEAL